MVLGYSGNASSPAYGNALLFGMLLLVVLDLVRLRFKLRRELATRFPDEHPQGHHLLRRDARRCR